MAKLTKTIIDVAKPDAKADVWLWDPELPGFGVRVFPSGLKSFLIQYRNASAARTRRMTIGRYGPLTPEEARTIARRKLLEVAGGEDPVQAKQDLRQELTFGEFSKLYLERHARAKKKPKSVHEDERILEDHLSDLDAIKVSAVNRAMVAKLHAGMSGTPIMANRTVALLSKMMSLAEVWGYRPDGSNPCRGIERYKEAKRKRYLTSAEMTRLGKVLQTEETKRPVCVRGVRLLLLSGMRLNEVFTLKWSYVDFKRGALNLPDSKTGEKDVVLGGAALQLLVDVPEDKRGEWVLPSVRRKGRHIVNLNGFWEEVREAAGIKDVRIHDLRHAFGAVGAGAGLSLPMVGALLGHSQPATTARYAHLADAPLRHAADVVSGEIAAALAKKDDGKVVKMPKRGGDDSRRVVVPGRDRERLPGLVLFARAGASNRRCSRPARPSAGRRRDGAREHGSQSVSGPP